MGEVDLMIVRISIHTGPFEMKEDIINKNVE